MITGKTLVFGKMHEKQIEAENINNYVLNSNDDAIKHSEGQTYFIANISTHQLSDHGYFGELHEECFNDEVSEAYYNYLLSIDVSNFQAQRDMPKTLNKKDMIAHNLAIEFKFIKDIYILKKTNSTCKPSELYLNFKEYCRAHYTERRINGKHKFYMKLREISLHSKKSNGFLKYVLNYKELEELFQKQGWIHELDYDKMQDDDDDKSNSLHNLDFGLTGSEVDHSESSTTSNDLAKQIVHQKKEIEDLQVNYHKSIEIQQFLLNLLNDQTLYESTKHQINDIIKNYNGKSLFPTKPVTPKIQIETSKPKWKPLPRNIVPFEFTQLVQPIEVTKEDLTFQKLKEKLLKSPVTYEFVNSDEEDEVVDDLDAEINVALSLF